ncbi:MAG: hypothetical protein LBE12_15920 [Planctomycetaceae bacterium]|nr:hypothetical protein [Planctomycetaceae bacterium]
MCITVGVAKRNLRSVKMPNITKPRTGRDYQPQQSSSRPCGALENWGVPTPAVALRFTAGYAFHTPSGVKSEKQKFH